MKKKLMLLICSLFIFPLSVKADHMYQIDMDIEVLENGTANIVEVWDVKASSGSEWYKQLYNLGNSELSNLLVSMDGKELTYKNWNINEELSEKAGYYGINYNVSGLEICFGKTDMKKHKFTISYTLSNYVFNTSDSQVLYWTMLPNVTVDNFSITLSSYYNFPDTLDVWGYGYKGYAYVKDGKIYMSNDGKLKDDYVVLLAKFPLNTFNVTNTVTEYNTIDDVITKAEAGTYDYSYNNFDIDLQKMTPWLIITIIISSLFTIALVIIITKILITQGYGYKDNKKINQKNIAMYRDIPCNKDIYYANVLIKLNSYNYKDGNIFSAIILKWVKEGKILFKTTDSSRKKTNVIDLTLNPTFDNQYEETLFGLMYAASGDGILESKELEKWCRNNYNEFLNLFKRIDNIQISELKNQNHIYQRTDKKECKKKQILDDMIYEDSLKLMGLKKFLQEFSKIDTKEVMDVHLWDEYLMFASLFGIADKVANQLKKLYPNEVSQINYDYNTIIFINSFTSRSISSASNAKSSAEYYSSGGGGFSSGGGGGDSFGGGGSMGGR